MNKLLLVLLLLLAGGSAMAQTSAYKDFLGKWGGTDEEKHVGSLNFLDSSRLMMSMMGREPVRVYYRLDASGTPVKLDIYRDPSRTGMSLKCLIQLLGPDSLKWQVFPDGKRLDHFQDNSDGTLIVLKREQ
jgi:hypothetical protein